MWQPVSNLEELHRKAYEALEEDDTSDCDEEQEDEETDFNFEMMRYRGR